MTFPIPGSSPHPPNGPDRVTPASHARASRAAEDAFARALEEKIDPLDSLPPSPPPEVLDEVRAAAQNVRRLYESGRELRFGIETGTGRMSVDVCDRDGTVLRSIPPSLALDVAAGNRLDEVL